DLETEFTPTEVKQVLWEQISPRLEGLILELGPGSGFVFNQIEASQKVAVDIALEYLKLLDPSALRICADVEDVPLQDGIADTIICTDVLEHVLHVDKLVAEINRLLKPGGRLLLATPWEQDLSVYETKEYKENYAKYKFVHLRSVNQEMVDSLFPNYRPLHTHLITEGMKYMKLKPYPLKFHELEKLS
ncbi:MAG: methyltransferase domain-containing protein, partial [Bacteroidota bacterium]